MTKSASSRTSGYFPRFSTKGFELKAYQEVADAAKSRMLPLVTLTRLNHGETFQEAFEAVVVAANGNRVIVDFDHEPKPVTSAAEAATLRARRDAARAALGQDPSRPRSEKELALDESRRVRKESFNRYVGGLSGDGRGLGAWVEEVARFDGLIPSVRLSNEMAVAAQLDVAQRLDLPVALVVDAADSATLRMAGYALRRLHDPSRSFLLVDSGYVRNRATHAAGQVNFALEELSRSGASFDAIRRVAIGGSFPSSSLKDMSRVLAMEEHEHHRAVAASWEAGYGDHASLPLRAPRAGGNGWLPHVDLVTDGHWNVHLDEVNSDPNGYVRAARELVSSGAWHRRTDCWGTRAISAASAGDTTFDGVRFTVPGPWIGARANQHLTAMAMNR